MASANRPQKSGNVTTHGDGTNDEILFAASKLGFFGSTTPVAKPTITGLKGSNAALGSLITALVALGLITDTSGA